MIHFQKYKVYEVKYGHLWLDYIPHHADNSSENSPFRIKKNLWISADLKEGCLLLVSIHKNVFLCYKCREYNIFPQVNNHLIITKLDIHRRCQFFVIWQYTLANMELVRNRKENCAKLFKMKLLLNLGWLTIIDICKMNFHKMRTRSRFKSLGGRYK